MIDTTDNYDLPYLIYGLSCLIGASIMMGVALKRRNLSQAQPVQQQCTQIRLTNAEEQRTQIGLSDAEKVQSSHKRAHLMHSYNDMAASIASLASIQ